MKTLLTSVFGLSLIFALNGCAIGGYHHGHHRDHHRTHHGVVHQKHNVGKHHDGKVVKVNKVEKVEKK